MKSFIIIGCAAILSYCYILFAPSNHAYYYNAYDAIEDEFLVLKSYNAQIEDNTIYYDDHAVITTDSTAHQATIISRYFGKVN